jgi:hypothetical protein
MNQKISIIAALSNAVMAGFIWLSNAAIPGKDNEPVNQYRCRTFRCSDGWLYLVENGFDSWNNMIHKIDCDSFPFVCGGIDAHYWCCKS